MITRNQFVNGGPVPPATVRLSTGQVESFASCPGDPTPNALIQFTGLNGNTQVLAGNHAYALFRHPDDDTSQTDFDTFRVRLVNPWGYNPTAACGGAAGSRLVDMTAKELLSLIGDIDVTAPPA
ncbi:MAG TPA: hypothetical protein VFH51_19115 [Myxococcota bacterium]|nr:hypothetical protein [Myxococcota bacterium]